MSVQQSAGDVRELTLSSQQPCSQAERSNRPDSGGGARHGLANLRLVSFDELTLWRANGRAVRPRVNGHLHDLGDMESATSAHMLDLLAATEAIGDNEG